MINYIKCGQKIIISIFLALIGIIFISGCVQSPNSTSNLIPLSTQIQEPKCIPEWQCTDWSQCSTSGTQLRKCNDNNGCRINAGEPSERQSCTIKYKENCPDFSSLSDRVSCGSDSCQFELLPIGQSGQYKLYPWDAVIGEFYPYSFVSAPCRKGIEEGENVNYYYCDGMYTLIKETDSVGNILSSKKLAVKLVLSNSKIIDSICEEN